MNLLEYTLIMAAGLTTLYCVATLIIQLIILRPPEPVVIKYKLDKSGDFILDNGTINGRLFSSNDAKVMNLLNYPYGTLTIMTRTQHVDIFDDPSARAVKIFVGKDDWYIKWRESSTHLDVQFRMEKSLSRKCRLNFNKMNYRVFVFSARAPTPALDKTYLEDVEDTEGKRNV